MLFGIIIFILTLINILIYYIVWRRNKFYSEVENNARIQ